MRSDDGAVATITLTNPERLNAFSGDEMLELRGELRSIAEDADVRALVITGAGRGFCAGGDVRTFTGPDRALPDPGALVGEMRSMVEVTELLHGMPKVTIAAINGACAGAGLSLALAADLRIAATSAMFTTAFVKVGQSGDYGSAWLLKRTVDPTWARRLLLLSEKIDAVTALRIGLVHEVVDDGTLLARARTLADVAAAHPPSTLAAIKANLETAQTENLSDYLDVECERFVANLHSEESHLAAQAYLTRHRRAAD